MLLSLCLALIVSGVRGQDEPPPSPCPEIFHYSYDSGQWSGLLKVPVPDQAKRMVVVTSLVVIDVALPPEHPGELQLLQDESKVREQIRLHQAKSVDYLLELPAQSPLPVIDKIKINSKVICEGPKVKAKTRTKVTYVHRLNGLRPPASKDLGDQSGMQQSQMLDMHHKFNEQGPREGIKGKDTAYFKLELLENEVVKEMIQENDIFPKGKNQGRGFDIDEQDGEEEEEEEEEEAEPLPDRELDLNADSDYDSVDAASRVNSDDEDEEDEEEEDLADDDLNPKGDTEMLDNTPEVGNPNVKTTKPDPNDSDDEEDDDDYNDDDDDDDISDNPNEDAEMLDNKISEAVVPVPKKPDANNFKTTEFNRNDVEDFSSNELDAYYDDDELDNELNPIGGSEPLYRPDPRLLREGEDPEDLP